MRKTLLAVFLTAVFSASSTAQKKASPRVTPSAPTSLKSRLEVKRVVLYKNGVGYFEHTARIHGTQDLGIDFTTAQLNDVIKSLTVVDMGDGRISGVRYDSIASLQERLRSLRLPLGINAGRDDLLSSLRGVTVEIRNGSASATGKVLSMEQVKRTDAKTNQVFAVAEMTLVSDAGEVRTVDLGPSSSVLIKDREVDAELGRYLNLIGSTSSQDLRHLIISDTGSGDRDVFVSYISEVPVWKSTYRILMPSKPGGSAILQGWAIVDNTSGDDWKDVQLSLVAGAPQTFVQDISQPYYVRRPVVPLPTSVMLTPQTHEGTMEAAAPPTQSPGGVVNGLVSRPADRFSTASSLGGIGAVGGNVKDQSGASISGANVEIVNQQSGEPRNARTDNAGNFRIMNVPAGSWRLVVSKPGFNSYSAPYLQVNPGRLSQVSPALNVGSTNESIEVAAEVSSVPLEGRNYANLMVMKPGAVEAEGADIGDFFEYDLKQRITVDRNQSALVPIIQAKIQAEPVTLWNESSGIPLRALWMTNNSGLELDSGTFNILEKETFAGEGTLDAIRPGEKRLISYAADPALRVKMDEDSNDEPINKIVIDKGIMIIIHESRQGKIYTIHNSDLSPRQVIIEHPVREDWKLAGALKPEETSASFYRFRVPVEAGNNATLRVEEVQPEETQLALTNLTGNELTALYEQKRVTPEMDEALKKILAQKSVISVLDLQISDKQQEIDSISTDQNRIRENMKALRGSPEEKALLERYTKQLDSQEDRLATLRSEIGDLKTKRLQAGVDLSKMVGSVVLSQTF